MANSNASLSDRKNPASRNPADFEESRDGSAITLTLSGDWRHHSVGRIDQKMRDVAGDGSKVHVTVDLTSVDFMDTAGAWLIRRISTRLEKAGGTVRLRGGDPRIHHLIGFLEPREENLDSNVANRPPLFERIFAPIGSAMVEFWDDLIASLGVLGAAVRGAQMKLGHGAGVSPASVVSQVEQMGVRAVPIILLMSFLIGGIIAQQGAFQLRYFGAEIFVVDLVSILQLREIGVLLTAIMIAGRSGSAITAEIGSMKMREEIDALTVMGLNPVGVLVFPRLVALCIALPLLTIVANFAALVGAATITWAYSGITPDIFVSRLREAIDMSTVLSGMIKAPFMALIIGIVASVEGMKVGGSAESLGRRVTASVVKSIFVVILVDGIFAVFFAAIDF